MRKQLLSLAALILAGQFCFGQKKDIIKTGYNFGPLPVVAFDADKGFQYGALLNVFNYGDGSNYPNYDSKMYLEASFFTKGSQLYVLSYDNKSLIPGVRWSSAIFTTIDKAMDFYGFNGYQSYYDHERVALGKANKKGAQSPENFIYSPYYRYGRVQVIAKSDFIGTITDNLKWELGYHFSYFKVNAVNRESINKGKDDFNLFPDSQPTLYEQYRKWGLISDDEAEGGISSSVRMGLVYDSRDKEGAPTRGIWAETHLSAAPKWLGTKNPFYRYSLTFRQYIPFIPNDVLTFAYRINYEGTIGSSAPMYVLPYMTVMGDFYDRDGMGGYRTVRGMMRDRVVGLDMATATAELRWRFVRFPLFNQNIAFGLNLFSDASMVTRGRDMTFRGDAADKAEYDRYMALGLESDRPHVTVGGGLRFIMNENFIVAFDYGAPVSRFLPKTSPLYGQDGNGAFYINTGFLF